MGQTNPDRVPIRYRRRGCETVGQMLAGRWNVTSKCQACGLEMRVDLKLIALVKGPGFSLWNKRGRCRRLLCNGAVDFLARSPDMAWHEPLRAPEAEDPRR